MSNSKRSIIFFISFMTVMCIISFVVPGLPINYDTPVGDLIFNNIMYFLALVVFPFIQMLIRYFTTTKYTNDTMFSLAIGGKGLYNRLVYYIIAFFIFFIPLITMKSLAYINTKEVLSLIVWLIVIEVMIRISKSQTKLHFTRDGILVRGIDMSIDIPLGNDLMNHSGFYYYTSFDEYELIDDQIKLYLASDRGHIQGVLPAEIKEPILAYLGTKHIGHIKKHI